MKSFTKYILGQHTGVGVEVDGMWQALFVTFLVYAMMPLKTWIAVAFSTIIAGTHITVTSFLDNTKIGHHWQQVICFYFLFFSIFLMVYYVMSNRKCQKI